MNTPLTLLLPTGSRLGGPGTPQRNAGRGDQASEAGIEFFEWLQQQEEPAAVSA